MSVTAGILTYVPYRICKRDSKALACSISLTKLQPLIKCYRQSES